MHARNRQPTPTRQLNRRLPSRNQWRMNPWMFRFVSMPPPAGEAPEPAVEDVQDAPEPVAEDVHAVEDEAPELPPVADHVAEAARRLSIQIWSGVIGAACSVGTD